MVRQIVFCSGHNAPTLFRNIQKMYLTCRNHGTQYGLLSVLQLLTPRHTRVHLGTPEYPSAHQSTPRHTRVHLGTPEYPSAHHSTPRHTRVPLGTPESRDQSTPRFLVELVLLNLQFSVQCFIDHCRYFFFCPLLVCPSINGF